jgi:serine/threonine protein kinase/Tol biopolymer transport system component
MIGAERWREIEQHYHSALECDESQRAAFLERACAGDEELRKEVESLLKYQESAENFIEAPALEVAAKMLADDESKFVSGQRIGHYEIVAPLGEGGMGEVYLARDLKLYRKIALKVLPALFTKDAERVRRFEREARAASALNHPNVCVIHEVDETEDGRHYIAMEYIEGVTLRQLMTQKRLELTEALDIAIQVASALATAHAAGIVHRDIKPENIMARSDGYIKVLDFGVAKLTERPAIDLNAATRIQTRTEAGTVIGTVNYMSPEQARGLSVDTRTDIWSMGVVLYELVAGHAPFSGPTPSDVIVEVLDREPPPLALEIADVPAELERIVRKALRKDREERYQTIKDLALDLKSLRRELEFQAEIARTAPPASGTAARFTHSEPASRAKTKETISGRARSRAGDDHHDGADAQRKVRIAMTLALGVLLLAGIAFGVYKFFGSGRTKAQAGDIFRQNTITKLTTNGNARSAAISPDGKYVAYSMNEAGKHSLWVRQVAVSSNIRLLPPSDDDYYVLTFSPDGSYIYYVVAHFNTAEDNNHADLYKVPVLGGSGTKVFSGVTGPGCFSPDGKQIAIVSYDSSSKESVLSIANPDGTGMKKLTAVKDGSFFGWSAWSPDGKIIACALMGFDSAGVYANVIGVRVADGTEQKLSTKRWQSIDQMTWLSDGSGLLLCAKDEETPFEQIWELSYPGGQYRKLTNDLSDYYGVSLTADSHALVTLQAQRISNVWVSADRDVTHGAQVTSGAGTYYDLAWTPDGKILYASDATGSADIWEMNADSTEQKQLTAAAGRNYAPAISPDGRYIVFHSNRSGSWQIWQMNRDGSNPKQLTNGNTDSNWPEYSPDGKWVIYQHSESAASPGLWRVPSNGGSPVKITDKPLIRPTVSPDGKLIACWQGDNQLSSRLQITVIPFAGGQAVKVFELPPTVWTGWDAPLHWTPDGQALTYIDMRGGIPNIWSQPLNGGAPKQLTDFRDNQMFSFAWSGDFKLATARGLRVGDAILITDSR